jgi:hypothetical protein
MVFIDIYFACHLEPVVIPADFHLEMIKTGLPDNLQLFAFGPFEHDLATFHQWV